MNPVLVVDDDPGFRKLLESILRAEGHEVASAAKVAEARRALAQGPFALVISDLKLPDGDGLDVQRALLDLAPNTPFVLITGFASVPTAVEAMKRGALDYLEKPLRSPDELRRLVRRALALPAAAAAPAESACGVIAEDPRMLRVTELLRRVAPTSATVLLLGESGVGKEVLARCVHAHSRRAAAPFVAVNAAALSPSLIESELFGHEKGAFTGAAERRTGLFERAHTGTLFLDEIGELDPPLQAKLLRVLQERRFERVGGNAPVEIDVRIVAATHRDLPGRVRDGLFRQDLFFRLSAFPLEVPPLRERPADIAPLAAHFLSRAAARLENPRLRLPAAASAALAAYPWPGNVRELENVIERAAILAEDEILPEHLLLPNALPTPTSLPIRELERQAIEDALRRHSGNRTRAARDLGISLRTLQYRLKDYGPGAD